MKYLGADLKLDSDGNLVATAGDIALVEGADCLEANLLDRMLCSENELLMHPEFGAGLADRVSMPMNEERMNDLAVEVKHELLNDPRVEEVTSLEVQTEGRYVYVRVTLKVQDGQIIGNLVFPFELELEAS